MMSEMREDPWFLRILPRRGGGRREYHQGDDILGGQDQTGRQLAIHYLEIA